MNRRAAFLSALAAALPRSGGNIFATDLHAEMLPDCPAFAMRRGAKSSIGTCVTSPQDRVIKAMIYVFLMRSCGHPSGHFTMNSMARMPIRIYMPG